MHDESCEDGSKRQSCVLDAAKCSACADSFPTLPIMLSTRLQLELLYNSFVIDLQAVAEVVLADVGAVLQILRLAGQEYEQAEDHPGRIEDCIVDLGMTRCYEVICEAEHSLSNSYTQEWQSCRRMAECAREIARCVAGASLHETYLVGLLHRLGEIPQLLGWTLADPFAVEPEFLGAMLASHWRFPDYLLAAYEEQHSTVSPSLWKMILPLATEMSTQQAQ